MAEAPSRSAAPSRSGAPSRPGATSRPAGRSGDSGDRGGPKRRFQIKRKVCRFCVDKAPFIDYKDIKTLKFFITERGKILPRRISGNCARHQRELTVGIQRSRNIALLPFSGEKQ